MDLPVLIYISKYRCPACDHFKKEWEQTKQKLAGRARFVQFACWDQGKDLPPPPVLDQYSGWFPSIVLAGPKSYYRCFNPDDQINTAEYSNSYTIKGIKFNAVKTNDGYEFGGRPNTAEAISNWFNQVVGTIPSIDEATMPSGYSNSQMN